MTRDQYLQLVQSSQSFQNMSPELQKTILEATDDNMLAYAKIFQEERNVILEAKKTLIAKNEAAVKKFLTRIKEIKTEKRKDDEASTIKAEEKEEEALLQELNNL